MPRANLGRLLDSVEPPTPVELAPQPVDVGAVEERQPSSVRAGSVTAAEAQAEPLYLRLVRKEVRLREDQLAALTVEARRLNRARRNRGHRVTENTLIRIAIDLLMDRISGAAGDDEDALRESLRP